MRKFEQGWEAFGFMVREGRVVVDVSGGGKEGELSIGRQVCLGMWWPLGFMIAVWKWIGVVVGSGWGGGLGGDFWLATSAEG